MAEYRDKKPVLSTVGSDQRVVGRFAVTGATVGACRPSAGSTAANGAGNVFTVSVPTAGSALFQVTLAEGYYLPIGAGPEINVPFNTSATSVPAVNAYASVVDSTSNSFLIYVVNSSGTVLTGATTPTAAAGLPSGTFISFELVSKQSVSPASL